MTCEDARTRLLDFVRHRLDPAMETDVGAHVAACTACASAAKAEQALDELLQDRLPRYEAPVALERRLGLLLGQPEAVPRRPPRRWRIVAPAMAAGLALVAIGVALQRGGAGRDGELALLASEAVNDHLRVLASQHPVDVESGGTHQVKPWFEGKLDFAPVVPALEGTDVHLRGGAVGYVFDRKAAVLVYQLRLHVVTLFVFRADGLAWPEAGGRWVGPARVQQQSIRGFTAFLWRDGGLGYALVSDVNANELSQLATRVVAETAPGPRR
jgi:anti-sigma factor RsiW